MSFETRAVWTHPIWSAVIRSKRPARGLTDVAFQVGARFTSVLKDRAKVTNDFISGEHPAGSVLDYEVFEGPYSPIFFFHDYG